MCKVFLNLRKILTEPVLMIPLGLLFEQSLAEGKVTGNIHFMRMCLRRSSRSYMSFKVGLLENFAKFTVKHLCRSAQNFIKKEAVLQVCFPMNFAKFLGTLF